MILTLYSSPCLVQQANFWLVYVGQEVRRYDSHTDARQLAKQVSIQQRRPRQWYEQEKRQIPLSTPHTMQHPAATSIDELRQTNFVPNFPKSRCSSSSVMVGARFPTKILVVRCSCPGSTCDPPLPRAAASPYRLLLLTPPPPLPPP
mmetsp:Transcript_27203/g.75046  ORF Transcript_27203/g.75046 Transcript_27203/m.75046 type:complete len:147 (-) Transcript_27203:388-828(-)